MRHPIFLFGEEIPFSPTLPLTVWRKNLRFTNLSVFFTKKTYPPMFCPLLTKHAFPGLTNVSLKVWTKNVFHIFFIKLYFGQKKRRTIRTSSNRNFKRRRLLLSSINNRLCSVRIRTAPGSFSVPDEKNGGIAPTARSFSTTSTEESTTP